MIAKININMLHFNPLLLIIKKLIARKKRLKWI